MKISIIVPVYNVEQYIVKCIDSIIKQDFDKQKYEILVIDDGCKDNSINLVKNTFKDIENLKIIHQKNKGLSAARNTGLKNASGEYIIFIDSDDFIEEDFCKTLYEYISVNNLDVVFGSYKFYFNDKKIIPCKSIYDNEKILSREDGIKKLLKKKTYRAEVWDDIYKREFIEQNNIRFIEGVINEDEAFTLEVLIKASKIGYLNYNGYIYRQREGSITKNINYEKLISSRFILLDNFMRLSNNTREEISKQLIVWRIDSLFDGLIDILKQTKKSEYYKSENVIKSLDFLKINGGFGIKFKCVFGIKFYVFYSSIIKQLKLFIKKVVR